MTQLPDEQARFLRLEAQQLVTRQPASEETAVQVVRMMVGIQAQNPVAARLALRARCQDLAAATLDAALEEERSLVRTWCLRGTLHLVAAEDLAWLLALLAPRLIQAGARRRAELGLDADTGRRSVQALAAMLQREGPLTRPEIAARLAEQGIPTAGQATIHAISLAALEGAVCYGPLHDGQATFVSLRDWIDPGPVLSPEDAATELARRYLAGYGPATPGDLAAWSGLPAGQARAAWQRLAGRLIQVTVRGAPAWLLQEDAVRLHAAAPNRPVVRLVPGYDPYLLGYRGRDLAVDPEHARQIHPGGGVLHPAILVDGRAAGTWTTKRRRKRVEISLRPFPGLGPVDSELNAEVQDVARFLEGAGAAS
jgi:hypothetical protein